MIKVDSKCLTLTVEEKDIETSLKDKEIVKFIYAGYSDSSMRKWDTL